MNKKFIKPLGYPYSYGNTLSPETAKQNFAKEGAYILLLPGGIICADSRFLTFAFEKSKKYIKIMPKYSALKVDPKVEADLINECSLENRLINTPSTIRSKIQSFVIYTVFFALCGYHNLTWSFEDHTPSSQQY